MVEHKMFIYLYLGKLGKLANTTKKNFGKRKLYMGLCDEHRKKVNLSFKNWTDAC